MLCGGGGGAWGRFFLYKSNISNPGDVVVTDEMRPAQPQGPIPKLNPPTSEHQHARRDRRHHDDTPGLGRAADHGPRDGRGKNNGDYIVTLLMCCSTSTTPEGGTCWTIPVSCAT